jgi:hypothetical protein
MYEPTEVDREVVRALSLFGAPHEKIANFIGISRNTLLKYYQDLLDNCKEDKHDAVEMSLFYNATVKKNVDAQKYWLSNHCKERYNNKPYVSGEESEEVTGIKAVMTELIKHLPD